MSYALFLDDTRDPPMPLGGFFMASEVLIARDYWDFCGLLNEHGCPEFISFDHDLGKGKETGMDCAKRFINAILDREIVLHNIFRYAVHSQNPAGKANIEALMTRFLKCYRAGQFGTIRRLLMETF